MKAIQTILIGLFFVLCVFNSSLVAGTNDVYVRSYIRSNGTFVNQHYRSFPDGNFYNNWSTKGNINPYTGSWGTQVTPPQWNYPYQIKPNQSFDPYKLRR
ncbi:MAG: hypothetical protein N2450_06430 [bacterium]|nr:hypothetical protein [bacterium]